MNTAIAGAEGGVHIQRRNDEERCATQILDFLRRRHDSNKKPALGKEPVSTTTKHTICQSKIAEFTAIDGGRLFQNPSIRLVSPHGSEIAQGTLEGILDRVLQERLLGLVRVSPQGGKRPTDQKAQAGNPQADE